ncbi:MAG: hypothetical protein VX112_02190 [Pseudomonadota bacterium]|nr:hypothetical protein [Pseudomonadota bacterium]
MQYPGQNRKRLEGEYIEQWVVDQIPQNHNVNGTTTPGGQILTHHIVIKSLDLQNANENELSGFRDIAPNAILKTWEKLDETNRSEKIYKKLKEYEKEVKISVIKRMHSGVNFYRALTDRYSELKQNNSPISQLKINSVKEELVLLEKDHQSNLPEHLNEYKKNWNNFNRECIKQLRKFESRLTEKCIDLGINIRDHGSSAEDWNLALIKAASQETTRYTQKFPLTHSEERSGFSAVDKNTRYHSRPPSR